MKASGRAPFLFFLKSCGTLALPILKFIIYTFFFFPLLSRFCIFYLLCPELGPTGKSHFAFWFVGEQRVRVLSAVTDAPLSYLLAAFLSPCSYSLLGHLIFVISEDPSQVQDNESHVKRAPVTRVMICSCVNPELFSTWSVPGGLLRNGCLTSSWAPCPWYALSHTQTPYTCTQIYVWTLKKSAAFICIPFVECDVHYALI